MAKNLLRRVITASFRRAENADATNVTRCLVLAHEAITPSSGSSGADDLRPDRTPAGEPCFIWSAAQQARWRKASPRWQADRPGSRAASAVCHPGAWRLADDDPGFLDWLTGRPPGLGRQPADSKVPIRPCWVAYSVAAARLDTPSLA